jgi:hypothetical protein
MLAETDGNRSLQRHDWSGEEATTAFSGAGGHLKLKGKTGAVAEVGFEGEPSLLRIVEPLKGGVEMVRQTASTYPDWHVEIR